MIPIFSLMPGLRFEPHFSFYYLFSSNIFMCVCVKVVQVIAQYYLVFEIRTPSLSTPPLNTWGKNEYEHYEFFIG